MKKSFIYNFCLTLAALFLTASAWAQNTVQGTVVDENGEPVIGATVVVVGTQHGTTTGIDGQFHMVVEKGNSLLSPRPAHSLPLSPFLTTYYIVYYYSQA